MTKLPVLMAFAAIAACPIAPTHAGSNEIQRSETVHYSDLNLNDQAGAVALYRRLRTAAADVCSVPDVDRYGSVPDYYRCFDDAMGDAVASVGQPVLTTYAQTHGVAVASRKGGRPN
jgi:UrcA family protein